jgi:hypothetical protein
LEEVLLELTTVFFDPFFWVFAHDHHRAHMAFAEGVLLEAVLIAHLALADLAEPSETLQAFLSKKLAQRKARKRR